MKNPQAETIQIDRLGTSMQENQFPASRAKWSWSPETRLGPWTTTS